MTSQALALEQQKQAMNIFHQTAANYQVNGPNGSFQQGAHAPCQVPPLAQYNYYPTHSGSMGMNTNNSAMYQGFNGLHMNTNQNTMSYWAYSPDQMQHLMMLRQHELNQQQSAFQHNYNLCQIQQERVQLAQGYGGPRYTHHTSNAYQNNMMMMPGSVQVPLQMFHNPSMMQSFNRMNMNQQSYATNGNPSVMYNNVHFGEVSLHNTEMQNVNVGIHSKDHKTPSGVIRRGSQQIAVCSQSGDEKLMVPKNSMTNEFRRPLTAYNFFFSAERDYILKAFDHIPDAELSEKIKVLDSSGVSTKTIVTEAETESLTYSNVDTASILSNSTPTDDFVLHLQELIAKVEFSPEELSEIEELAKTKIKLLLDVHMEADRVKKPHRKTHGKIGFKTLGKLIGLRWRNIDPEKRTYFEQIAKEDIERYNAQVQNILPHSANAQASTQWGL